MADADGATLAALSALPTEQLLPQLLHESPAVRARAATLVGKHIRLPDAPRAALITRWAGEAAQDTDDDSYGAPENRTTIMADERERCARAVNSPSFVSIPYAESALSSLALALASTRPVLLSGAAGSGKTTLVRELAQRLGQLESIVVVHMDEQIDSKVLLGTYVCTEGAGEFAWQPGVVSQAVAHGRWLLLEDVDRAPLEVMAALAPLLEGGKL